MNEHETASPGAGQGAFGDPGDEGRGDRGVDGVAAVAQHLGARLRRERVARRDRPSHAATVPGKQPDTLNVREDVRRDLDLRSLISRRGLAAAGLFLAAIVVLATRPGVLGHDVRHAVTGIEDARPIWLWTAAFCFLGSLVATASAWRGALSLCGGRLSRSDACARYGIGSLVNGLSPVRVGEAARVALFAQALDGQDRTWRMGGVFCVVTAMRSLVFAVVVVCAAAVGALPLWPVLVLMAMAVAALGVAFCTRNRTPHTHVAHLLDAFRGIGRSPSGAVRMAAWFAASTGARFVGAAAIAAALGVHAPFTAALIIVPTLDLAGLIPLSGNFGITSGAVVVALEAHGVHMAQALSTGLAFHATETGAGMAFGVAGSLLLGGRRRVIVVAAAGAAACLAVAFCATVLVPLA
jgi:lysylphosphatidylglycerol synthase-like protein